MQRPHHLVAEDAADFAYVAQPKKARRAGFSDQNLLKKADTSSGALRVRNRRPALAINQQPSKMRSKKRKLPIWIACQKYTLGHRND